MHSHPTTTAQDVITPTMGDVVDRRYRVHREVAVGGMARVLEVEHAHLASRLVLKVPLPEALREPEVRLRLLREGQALARARGAGVPVVHDAGVDPVTGVPFLAMELVDGKSLDGLLASRGKLDVRTATAIALQLCDTLARCHAAAVVHRDLKPGNVLIHRDDHGLERPILIDFGITALGAADGAAAPSRLTHRDELIGTFEYMAPEQLIGAAVDGRADLWAVAISFFELVTGEVPFTGPRTQVIASIVGGAKIPPLAGVVPGASPALDAVLARATAVDPAARFRDASAMGAALRAAVDARPDDVRLLPPTAPRTGTEARRHRRAPYATPVRIVTEAGPLDGRTEDISETGLLVMVRNALPVESRVDVRLCLPTSGRAVTVASTVRWVRAGRGAFAIGVEFAADAIVDREDIRRFVDVVGSGERAAR